MTSHLLPGQKPAVSVIIPTYNSSSTLRISLESVLGQDFESFEVIVVGDGCTDDSESVVASFRDERILWINLAENSGTPSAPRNEGLRVARGEFIAYLGHDDLWFPWHLRGLVGLIRESEADFVYSLGVYIGPRGVVSVFSLPRRLYLRHGGLSPSNWLHRKALIEDIGDWSLKTRVSDDQEFLRRMWRHRTKMGFHKELSVLKFPSAYWRLYSRTEAFPQESYEESLKQDAARLRLEVLQRFTCDLSPGFSDLSQGNLLTECFRGAVRLFVNLYGRNRWPVRSLLYRRYRRKAGL